MPSPHRLFITFVTLFAFAVAKNTSEKIYGVNLGNWLLFEDWMAKQEWKEMTEWTPGINSEWALVKAFPDNADEKFKKHWESWFTQDDVDKLQEYGINTVRIPLGFWIVEPLVNRETEHYPRGGLLQLKRGLKMLHKAGIKAILVHHALPGVAARHQEFAGQITEDVNFYTPKNYARALTWTAVMTILSHIDPDFKSVISIEAVNEPLSNAQHTPGLKNFYKHFAQVVRAVELSLGIIDKQTEADLLKLPGFRNIQADGDLKSSFHLLQSNQDINLSVRAALRSASYILTEMKVGNGMKNLTLDCVEPLSKNGLMVSFMDYQWQRNKGRANGAKAALGPAIYDDHLYLSFGGVAKANEWSYLEHICNLDRLKKDAEQGQTNVVFGEWSLATQFDASDSFLKKFADAQKLAYSKGAGWIFWNFKVKGHGARQWSYFEGVDRGYFTKDPSHLHDPNVCDPYRRKQKL